MGISYPSFHEFDLSRFMTPIPQAEGWFQDEGKAYIKINKDGFRDVDHQKQKPKDTIRIAVLGDSFAAAMQVPLEETFWHLMEKEMAPCVNPKKIEVLNFGVSGYGTAQELLTLREKVWDYSPDIVLLAFLPNNDLQDNSPTLNKKDFLPYFVFNQHGQLVLDESYKQSKTYRTRSSFFSRHFYYPLINHSRVMQLVRRYFEIKNQQEQTKKQNQDHDEFGTKSLVYVEPSDATWKEAWDITEGLMKMMNNEVNQHGAKLVVVSLAGARQVEPNPEVRQRFQTAIGSDSLFYPGNRINQLAEKGGFLSFDLAPAMQKIAEEKKIYFHGFTNTAMGTGHWNKDGHQAASRLMSQFLCSQNNSLHPH